MFWSTDNQSQPNFYANDFQQNSQKIEDSLAADIFQEYKSGQVHQISFKGAIHT